MRRILSIGLAGVLVLSLAGTALAAKGGSGPSKGGGGGSSSSISVVMVTDLNANAAPNWGDTITFAVTTSASTPIVVLNCYQSGVWVYTAQAGFYASYAYPPYYMLSSAGWTGGAASCTATLEQYNSNGKYTVLSTLNFAVGA